VFTANSPENITVTAKPEQPIDPKEFGNRVSKWARGYIKKALEELDVTVKVNQQF
jgi:hypothetical protein